MATVIPIEIFELLEKKVGREEAKEVIKVIEASLDTIEKKAETVAIQKKLEVKDELTKELITKAEFYGEIKTVRQEMETLRQEMETLRQEIKTLRQEMKNELLKLDRKFTIMFIILFFTIIFLNQNALEFFVRILGLIK
jgi:cell division protein FtsB